jgi:hypothetical protein
VALLADPLPADPLLADLLLADPQPATMNASVSKGPTIEHATLQRPDIPD